MDYEDLIRRADEATGCGREDEARQILTEGLERARADGSQGYVHLLEAELHALSGEYAEALEAGLAANEIMPGVALVMHSIGAYAFFLGKFDEAIEWFDKALLADPQDHNSMSYKGLALSTLDREDEAILCFDKALMTNPQDLLSTQQKGVSLSELGRQEEAIEWLDRALQIDPQDHNSIQWKGIALSRLGRHGEAIECFGRAVQISPQDYSSMRRKGIALIELDRHDEAIQWLDRVLQINPQDYDAMQWKIVALIELGRHDEAIQCFDSILEINPQDYDAMRRKGVSLSRLGREEEATQWFDRALQINPQDCDSMRWKGIALIELGRREEATRWFDKAIQTNPQDCDSMQWKGISLYNLGRQEEAVQWFDRALQINPQDYTSMQWKGISLCDLGRQEEAVQWFDKALSENPKYALAMHGKAMAQLRSGHMDDALQTAKVALERLPDDGQTAVTMAMVLEARSDEGGALTWYSRAAVLASDSNDRNAQFYARVKAQYLARLVAKARTETKDAPDKEADLLSKVVTALQTSRSDFLQVVRASAERLGEFVNPARTIPDDFPSFFSVLRRWNSYTPALPSPDGGNFGGGYFLHCGGRGIVIDPGFNFVHNFCSEGFRIADIDAVLITHAHNDHTVDLESILSLMYKMDDDNHPAEDQTRRIDLFINAGAFMKYSGWLSLHKAKSNYVGEITILQQGQTYDLGSKYGGLKIHATRAKHNELVSKDYCVGCVFEVEGVKVGLSSDTGWEPGGSIGEQFEAHHPNIMIVHLGSVKESEFDYVRADTEEERRKCFYPNHLGLLGVTAMLGATKPKLAIISEFGEELRGVRSEIARAVGETVGVTCLPGDIGMHVRLSDQGVLCFMNEEFVPADEIIAVVLPNGIGYHRKCYADQRLEDAKNSYVSWVQRPIYERVKSWRERGK